MSSARATSRCVELCWLSATRRLTVGVKHCSTNVENNEANVVKEDPRGKFAKAFDKFQSQLHAEQQSPQYTFRHLLRHAAFTDLGDATGKAVQGVIFKVVDNDLYVDFGWKFHCVCSKPKHKAGNYVRGARVRVLLKDLELSSKFLGYEKDVTLLEADGALAAEKAGGTG